MQEVSTTDLPREARKLVLDVNDLCELSLTPVALPLSASELAEFDKLEAEMTRPRLVA